MQIEKYLKERQPVIYQTFKNALLNDNLSHAYLLSGPQGSPLLETAIYLAKSIICDNPNPFACNECITCERVDNNNYPDFLIFNGADSTIKKTEVEEIEKTFEKEAFESKGVKIYVLHLIENMTVQAVNAMLKFLEEPGKKIYAFLTTNNESAILPTIISRCQTLHLKNMPREKAIELALEKEVPLIDAELLSYFYNDEELILEASNNDENYKVAKEALDTLLDSLSSSKYDVIYNFQRHISTTITTKESLRFFINMLIEIFEDMQSIKFQKQPILSTFADILRKLAAKCEHIDKIIIELLKANSTLNMNVNQALLLDHLVLMITKEIYHD